MCRFVAYLGERKISLSALVLEPEHSLLVQSYRPAEMLSGVVNADGFGVGWYDLDVDREPALYTSAKPIWADRNLASIGRKVRSRLVFAAVRSATPGLPAEESGVPPFAIGPFMFMHNGAIPDFRHTAMRRLRDDLSDALYASLSGVSDSETIFTWLVNRLGDAPPTVETLKEAVVETVRHVSGLCSDAGVAAGLNLALTDGESMLFSRYSSQVSANTLYVLEDGEAFPDAVVVASERLDRDPGWREVPHSHLLTVESKRGVTLHPL